MRKVGEEVTTVMARPNVFVGTLYSGEGDFDTCCEMVRRQAGINVKHVVIPDLPEREAHDALWGEWSAHKHEGFDVFVKVDADTVLAHTNVLSDVCTLFASDKDLTSVQAPLLDRFTDTFINGLNCFSPSVQFNKAPDLHCDRADHGHKKRIFAHDCPQSLRPAGHHCFHATGSQAFRFGLHRVLKGQLDIIARVHEMWFKQGDELRAFALLGAKAAHDGMHAFDYNSASFKETYERVHREFDSLVKEL